MAGDLSETRPIDLNKEAYGSLSRIYQALKQIEVKIG
jgi:hypothetical protein